MQHLTSKNYRAWRLCKEACFKCQFSTFNEAMPKTAGIIVIGDEILKGQTQDTNSHYLCQRLHSLGVGIKKISVIRDDIDIIAAEISKFSEQFDIVLTSGGIGPTHDDRTIEGISQAFGEQVIQHPTLVELCQKHFGQGFQDSPKVKLASVPQSAQLHFGVDSVKGERLLFPLISVKNVFIFPGIPVLMNRLFQNLEHLFKSDETFHVEKLLVNAFESDIASSLAACAKKFENTGVQIGSYPDWFNNYYKVKVTVESSNEKATKAAFADLKESLPAGIVLTDYLENQLDLKGNNNFGDVFKVENPVLHEKLSTSMGILEEALDRYDPSEICIGFNGGKDCTVLLHLFYAAMCRKFPNGHPNIQALYIKDKNPFEELEHFMEDSIKRYKLNVITLSGDMKPALRDLQAQRPNIKAVVMGTRCTDPYSKNLSAFTPTDGDWPQFMRVSPILNWCYRDIWSFLRQLYLPYCVLYDRGYTSLGSRERTKRNEKLLYLDEQGTARYRPAHCLQNENLERNGRL